MMEQFVQKIDKNFKDFIDSERIERGFASHQLSRLASKDYGKSKFSLEVITWKNSSVEEIEDKFIFQGSCMINGTLSLYTNDDIFPVKKIPIKNERVVIRAFSSCSRAFWVDSQNIQLSF